MSGIPKDCGWYLYGITRRQDAEAAGTACLLGLDGRGAVEFVGIGALAAAISPVDLVAFAPEAIRRRVQDLVWLETMVRGHERVVEAIHQVMTLLPAKFGSVHSSRADVVSAVADKQTIHLAQLDRVAQCDEFGVRLFADNEVMRQRATRENAVVQGLTAEEAAARPGLAYFLGRRIAAAVERATEQAKADLAGTAFTRLRALASAGEIVPRANRGSIAGLAADILHAVFLVERSMAPRFLDDIHCLTKGEDGLRCEYTGPWPPYSFVTLAQEEPAERTGDERVPAGGKIE